MVHSFVKTDAGDHWEIDEIPEDTNLPEEVVTKIAGSRLPVLFIEGDGGSLDSALYRRVYGKFTTIPVGSCDNVIHSVASFSSQSVFHRLGGQGVIDADGRPPDVIKSLASKDVHVIGVSEVENILLLPKPFLALAEVLQFNEKEAAARLEERKELVLKDAEAGAGRYAMDATRRQIDRDMKLVGLSSAPTIADLKAECATKFAAIDPAAIQLDDFKAAIAKKDYEAILRLYDSKGLLAQAANVLRQKSRKDLEELVGRTLQNEAGKDLLSAIRAELPAL